MDSPLSNTSSPLEVTPSNRAALGIDLLQTFFGLILYGLSVHQSYRYFRLFPSDARFIRILVVLVMALETVHTVFGMHSCYYLMVTHFFSPASTGVWSLNSISVVSSSIVLVSQMFFARRVFLLGGYYRVLVGFAILVLIGEIVLSIVSNTLACGTWHKSCEFVLGRHLMFGRGSETKFAQDLVVSALALPLLADLLFTSALIIVLRRSRLGAKRTEPKADLFTIYIVNTGVLHCVFNALAFFFSLGTTAMTVSVSPYLIFSTIGLRLYAISLLSALNCRDPNRGVVVFDPISNPNVFLFAQQRAEAEAWNVPQVQGDRTPASIQIGVATEMEGRKWDFATTSMSGSNTDKESY